MKYGKRLRVFLLALVFGLAGCVTEESALTGNKRSYGYTWEQELEIGKTNDKDLIREMGLYPDDGLSKYVTSVGERVLAESNLREPDTPEIYRDLRFTFRIMDSPVVNAFALPGGYVYVTRGLLAHLNNEAQLAVVLGHEITHVAARHASQQALKQRWGQIGLIAGAVIGQGITGNENFADQFLGVGSSVFQMLTLKYGRDAERESDTFGVEYSAKAGYAVGEAAQFFNSLGRISDKAGQRLPTWQSSHPDPGEREGRILQLAQEMKSKYGPLKVGEDEFLKQIDGLVVGENPRQGIFMRGKFYHPELDFQFDVPRDWQSKNEASSVTLADSQGRAVMVFSLAQGKTPQEAAENFLASSKVQPFSAGVSRVAGRSGYVIRCLVETSSGSISLENAFFAYEGSVFSFMSYTNATRAALFKPQFDQIVESFGPIEDKAIRDLQPARLRVVKADKTEAFQAYVKGDLPYGLDKADLAIINQVQLDETVNAGRKLKVVAE